MNDLTLAPGLSLKNKLEHPNTVDVIDPATNLPVKNQNAELPGQSKDKLGKQELGDKTQDLGLGGDINKDSNLSGQGLGSDFNQDQELNK